MARCEEEEERVEMNPSGLRSRVSSRDQTPESSQAAQSSSAPAQDPIAKLVAFDRRFSKWVHEHCLTDFTYAFLRFFEYSGDGLFWIPATAAYWASPKAGSPETRLFALNLFVSLLLDLIVVGTIKSLVRRKRPQYNRGHLVIVAMDHWSFPSGHSTRAVMVVTLIYLYTPLWRALTPHSFLAKCACVVWMLATACSRVVLGRHYLLDVVGGMVIGVLQALVAHFALHVPLKVSELQHAYLLSLFSLYQDAFLSFFHGRWFISSGDLGELNRQILEADLGPL